MPFLWDIMLNRRFICLSVSILCVQINKFSVMSGWTSRDEPVLSTSTKQGINCLAQGHSTVPPVRFEPATP